MTTVFDESRLQQLSINFACKTTPTGEISKAKRKQLFDKVRKIWPDLFESEAEPGQFLQASQPNQPIPGFMLKKQLFIGGGMTEVPTLLVVPDTVMVNIPRKIAGEKAPVFTDDLWLKGRVNDKARQIILILQDQLNFSVHRTGKIYEAIFAPIAPDELRDLSQHLFASLDEKPSNIESNLTFVRGANRHLNFLLTIRATPLNLEQPCQVNVKLDINNRDMTSSLDPHQITKVWDEADAAMPQWLFGILGGATS